MIGNPPWDMLRGDTGAGDVRGHRRQQARSDAGFFRASGIYVAETRAHANRYQFFVERALQLLRPCGRLGLVLPTGVFSDSERGLRRHLFDRARVDAISGMENRRGIFPIHRSVRFSLVTASAGSPTVSIACRFGLTRVDDLEAPGRPLAISRGLLARLSGGDDLGIPELGSERDLQIVECISARVPWLGHEAGWSVRFGRELNATDDRQAFGPRALLRNGRPVIEGKQLEPFHVDVARSGVRAAGSHAPAGRRAPQRTRLAYREVASATNRLTLIAALLPPDVVTTHTVFCLKTPLPVAHQRVLCALLNSFVANYLIRLRVNTHVTASLVSRLPVPLIGPAHQDIDRLDALVHTLMKIARVELSPDYVELQARVAHAYGLTASAFAHILDTFPLIPESVRRATLDRFAQTDVSRR